MHRMKSANSTFLVRFVSYLIAGVMAFAISLPHASAQQLILGDNWQELPGRAKDIGAGADGSVWIIGDNQSPYSWNDDAYARQQASGTAMRIAVLSDGNPVIVNAKNEVFRLRGQNWQQLPGRAIDIGAGADGSIWIIGQNGSVYSWNDEGYAWAEVGGTAAKISVLPDGTPVVVNAKEEIFRLRGQNWQQLPGRAKDIAAGADSSIWIIGANGSPYSWNEAGYAWEQKQGTGTMLEIAGPGIPLLVNAKEEIFRMTHRFVDDSN